MTLTVVAILVISIITGFITLTFAAYQEWRIKMFEREILKCLKIIRDDTHSKVKNKKSNTKNRGKSKCG